MLSCLRDRLRKGQRSPAVRWLRDGREWTSRSPSLDRRIRIRITAEQASQRTWEVHEMNAKTLYAATRRVVLGAVLGAALIAPPARAHSQLAASTFDTDLDGWTITGDSAAGSPYWVGSGGNPGGYAETQDGVNGDTMYWTAPAKFLGDDTAAYGHILTFDLQQSPNDDQFDDADVVLSGAGFTLVFDTPTNPALAPAWTSYAIPLNEAAGWQMDALGGPAPSQEEFLSALGSVDGLQIRAEYQNFADTDGLDNVVLHAAAGGPPDPPAAPEPGPAALAAGLLLAAGAAWRRARACKPAQF